jgi:hypothetical protein
MVQRQLPRLPGRYRGDIACLGCWRLGASVAAPATAEAAAQLPVRGPEVFDEISRELDFDPAMAEESPFDVGAAATDARDAGFTGTQGAPGTVDLATQSHSATSEVRAEYGVSGNDVQSAHIGPRSFLRDVPDYSRGRAETVLLDRDVHADFDVYWKDWAMEQRRAGRTQVPVSELHGVMLDAIEQIPGLPQRMRDAMAWRLDLELFRDLGLQPAHEATLLYPNIKPVPGT